jgi:hypothetical protein
MTLSCPESDRKCDRLAVFGRIRLRCDRDTRDVSIDREVRGAGTGQQILVTGVSGRDGPPAVTGLLCLLASTRADVVRVATPELRVPYPRLPCSFELRATGSPFGIVTPLDAVTVAVKVTDCPASIVVGEAVIFVTVRTAVWPTPVSATVCRFFEAPLLRVFVKTT